MGNDKYFGNIEPFTVGDDYCEYFERMDSIIKFNKITEDTDKSMFLYGVCGPDLYHIIKACVAPKLPLEVPYEELKKSLKTYFDPTINAIAERFRFYSRQQKEDESIGDYIVEIKALSKNCKFETFLDEALRDKLIFGVANDKIQSKLLSENDSLTFEKACTIARSMECTHLGLEFMQGKAENVSSIKHRLGPMVERFKKGRYANHTCHVCGKKGHIAVRCRSKPQGKGNFKQTKNNRKILKMTEKEKSENDEEDEEDEESDDGIGWLNNIIGAGPVLLEVSTNEQKIKMEVDCGACQSVIHVSDKNFFYPNMKLENYSKKLQVISGNLVKILGCLHLKVKDLFDENVWHNCILVVIDSEKKFTPLLGRPWLDKLFPNWRKFFSLEKQFWHKMLNDKSIASVASTAVKEKKVDKATFIANLPKKFPNVFSTKTSQAIKNFEIDIALIDGATPIFHKPYTVAYGNRPKVETILKKWCDDDLIYPVRNSAWATPIVTVAKPDGSIRICADCKVTINKFLRTDHYPLPRFDDLAAAVANTKVFVVLDLSNAFQQIMVSEKSREILTINTHLGLFRHKRLIFGISCAPTYFQSVMDQILHGLPHTVCFIDDILVGGDSLEDCMQNLICVLTRLDSYNVRVNKKKCIWFENKVIYLGHELSFEGIRPNKKKVEAIMAAPVPQNLQQLKSYLGLLNYYGKFIDNLSTELAPLYRLTKKDVEFIWSTECDVAFRKSKLLLTTDKLLVYYDPNKPLVIHCDASPYGLGAVLSHTIDGSEKPILFTSCTLTDTQKNYPQLHREALAVLYAVKSFHKYIFGKFFKIYSDHQPLREIFNEKKSIPDATGRLQRYAIHLSMYNYQIAYKKGSHMANADALSRLPLPKENDIEHIAINSIVGELPIDTKYIAEMTQNDSVLSKVFHCMLCG